MGHSNCCLAVLKGTWHLDYENFGMIILGKIHIWIYLLLCHLGAIQIFNINDCFIIYSNTHSNVYVRLCVSKRQFGWQFKCLCSNFSVQMFPSELQPHVCPNLTEPKFHFLFSKHLTSGFIYPCFTPIFTSSYFFHFAEAKAEKEDLKTNGMDYLKTFTSLFSSKPFLPSLFH